MHLKDKRLSGIGYFFTTTGYENGMKKCSHLLLITMARKITLAKLRDAGSKNYFLMERHCFKSRTKKPSLK